MKTDLSTFDSLQTRIITENSGRDIVVSASAGAGKTKVLVARILRRCAEDRIPVDRILALTFTSAAAGEMKNRLSAEFHALREKTRNEDEKAYLDEQIMRLSAASITTIDAFCLEIIRRFASTIGLEPAAADNILSEGRNRALNIEAYERALKSMCESEEGRNRILTLLEYFSPRPENYEKLYDIVCRINTHADSSVNPEEWYARCRDSCKEFRSLKQLPAHIREAWFDYLSEEIRAIISYARELRERLIEEPDKKVKPEAAVQTVSLMNHALSCINEYDYDGYLVLLKEAAVNKITKIADPAAEALRAAMHEKISGLLEISYETSSFAKNSGLHAEIISTLCDLCEKTSANFRKIKEELAVMNFSDMERRALEILEADQGRAAKKLNASFDEIMIDEFQDTSILQDCILNVIAEADRKIPVFRVGDVKQSIYRFRHARPQLMRDLMDSDDTVTLNMQYNYRSRDGIVRFTNLLFERLMNIQGIQDHYREEDHVSIGTEKQKDTDNEPAVEMILLDPGTDENGEPAKISAKESKNLKASVIARRICQMISESGGSLKFSDFAVLSRSHADQIVLRRYFDLYGIPYDIDAREGFYMSDLCRDIYSLACLIRNPRNEIALLSAATSPLFGLSDQQLAEVKISCSDMAEGIYETYPVIRQMIEEYQEILGTRGVTSLLSAIANTLISCPGHPEKIAFYDSLPRQDQANFDYLFDLVISAGISDLSSLIREIEYGESEKSSEAITTGKDDEAVTVTTIHHSKGLQYRIVFLWGTGHNRFSDAKEPVLIDDRLMLGIRDVDMKYRTALPTVGRLVIQKQSDLEDIEEFSRVLYVAVTRAVEKLIIVDNIDSAAERSPDISLKTLKARAGITGLITAALDHNEGINENGLFKVSVIAAEELPEPALKQAESGSLKMPRFSLKTAVLPEIRTPSSLEKSRSLLEGPEKRPVLPAFTPKQTGGSNYGTLMHKAAEMMDDSEEWTKEKIRLTADPSLPDKAVEDLYAFGHSGLYQRCKTMEIHKEYPFYYEDDEARINGTIDFAAIGKDEIIIIDFKTDKLSPEEIREEYSPQLNTYRKAMRHFYPDHKIEVYAWSFHNNTEILIEE